MNQLLIHLVIHENIIKKYFFQKDWRISFSIKFLSGIDEKWRASLILDVTEPPRQPPSTNRHLNQAIFWILIRHFEIQLLNEDSSSATPKIPEYQFLSQKKPILTYQLAI